jgi:serine/threonine protein kinase
MILVYEYHKSRDLRTILSSKLDISPAQRSSWALGAARALAFLHAQSPRPLLHMDIDTTNFLVEGMHVKLTDFSNCAITSLIGVWDDHSQLPRGNPAYMAPEQFKQEPLSEKTEVFSFGVILWELWTRAEPWKGVSMTSIEAHILVGDRLQIPVGEIPAPIARLVKKCWLEEPTDRPDMGEIVTVRCCTTFSKVFEQKSDLSI